uniref:FHIPEP family type III secretion protein n=1 Tax=Symbiobacterium terraclitae TaxID=557451 RepID=UPI0035B5388A
VIKAITLAPDVEQRLTAAAEKRGPAPALDPQLAQAVINGIGREAQAMAQRGDTPVLVCSPALRPVIRRIAQHTYPRLIVLSYAELDPRLEIESVGVIRA